ncbi:uncharacterized protein LOC127796632 isoform X2 [Diospyros lotus]|uniref:uncharacterized protein LOC127796632 isoform X2 n=1 Tax=Diospyros lotus TaxID=55363 RepID=UPI00225969C5|nr:uncharacterized protein LOC127796632 isoform X2 [Diospyros lotus]
MEATEGGGRSEMECTKIEVPSGSLDSSVMFYVVAEILGFVLHMHQQIPSTMQDISLEFESLKTEYKELMACAQTEVRPSLRRKNAGRKREVKQGIKRLEKLMETMFSLHTALQLMISEIPDIQQVMVVLGASPVHPLHVFEVCFSRGKAVSTDVGDFTKSRAAEGLSRKVVRTLISKGAGSDSYPGPTKLFLLVKAPSSLNMPLHFLPKRGFRYSKKIVPFRLLLKCKTQYQDMNGQTADSISLRDGSSNDLIWFQCRHVVKGLAFKTSSTED